MRREVVNSFVGLCLNNSETAGFEIASPRERRADQVACYDRRRSPEKGKGERLAKAHYFSSIQAGA
jgi:hypothetical protein